MGNNDLLQDFYDKPLTQLRQELEERSRARQREWLPIIKEKNKKFQEAEKAKFAEKKDKRRQQIETLKKYYKEGNTWTQCAKLMGCSREHIVTLRKEAQANRIWFTKRELEGIAILKESRKKGDNKSTKQIEVKSTEQEKRRMAFMNDYIKYKRIAKREDDSELNGSENVSTEGRKNFIKTLVNLQKLDMAIPDQEIEIVMNAFYLHPDMADIDSIKLLIMNAKERGGIETVKKRINDLLDSLGKTRFYTPLLEYKQWLEKRMSHPELLILDEDGMNDNEVALGLLNCLRKGSSKASITHVDCDMED